MTYTPLGIIHGARGNPKREKLETPPEILVWSPSEEKGPPLPKVHQTTTSPDSGEALLVTARRSEKASMNMDAEIWTRQRLQPFLAQFVGQ